MRNLSAEATRAGHDQQTDKVWIVLLEITATGLSTPIRIASDNQDVVHQGWTFIGYPALRPQSRLLRSARELFPSHGF